MRRTQGVVGMSTGSPSNCILGRKTQNVQELKCTMQHIQYYFASFIQSQYLLLPHFYTPNIPFSHISRAYLSFFTLTITWLELYILLACTTFLNFKYKYLWSVFWMCVCHQGQCGESQLAKTIFNSLFQFSRLGIQVSGIWLIVCLMCLFCCLRWGSKVSGYV